VGNPQRVENNARRKEGEFVRHPRIPQPAFELSRAVSNENGISLTFTATMQRQQDAHLYELGRAMKRSHARQWRDMEQVYRNAQRVAEEHGETPAEVRAGFLEFCARMRDTQAQQRRDTRAAWKARASGRKAAFGPFADREAVRRKARAYRMGLTRPRQGDERFGPKPPTPDF
jgi:hypothetical protein